MTRLQILELPAAPGDERPPFVFILDEVAEEETDQVLAAQESFNGFGQKAGARAVAVFHGMTVDLPANDTPAYRDAGSDSEHAGTTHIVYAHERTRLDLCSALLVSGDTTWRKLVEQVSEQQRELADLHKERQALDPKLVALVRETLGIQMEPDGIPYDEVLYSACRQLQASEGARAHLRGERAALSARLGRLQQVPTEPEVMNAQQEHPGVWKHGYHCGVLASKAAARPRAKETTKP